MEKIPTPEMAFEGVWPDAVEAATWEDIAASRDRAVAREKGEGAPDESSSSEDIIICCGADDCS